MKLIKKTTILKTRIRQWRSFHVYLLCKKTGDRPMKKNQKRHLGQSKKGVYGKPQYMAIFVWRK